MNKHVLIVEDESLVARDILGMVRGLGYEESGICSTGEDAVLAATEKKPDLILMDIVLKGAMDGVAAAAKIRESQSLPIIYLTAYADEKTLGRANRTEPQGYLLKPFDAMELRAAIELAFYKHAEEEKRRADRRWLDMILDFLGDAVIACDAKGLVTFMNPLAEKLTGTKSEDAVGSPLASTVRFIKLKTGQPMTVSAERILRKGSWNGPVRCGLIGLTGTEVTVDLNAVLVAGEGGELGHVAFIIKQASPQGHEEMRLAFSAIHDPLTGLPNRLLFEDRLELAVVQAGRKKEKVAVILVGFRRTPGDPGRIGREDVEKAFKQTAAGIAGTLRASDTIARFGENEIAILLPDIGGREEALEALRRARAVAAPGLEAGGLGRPANLMFGMALFPDDGALAGALLERAGAALVPESEKQPVGATKDGRSR
jgi:diguanylate cyclase (GGDEF)-like protein